MSIIYPLILFDLLHNDWILGNMIISVRGVILLFHLRISKFVSVLTFVNLPVTVRTEIYHILRVVSTTVCSSIEMMSFKIQIATFVMNGASFPQLWQTPSTSASAYSQMACDQNHDNAFSVDRAVYDLVDEWVLPQTVGRIEGMSA